MTPVSTTAPRRRYAYLIVAAGIFAFAGISPPASASDGIASEGKLSDSDFYRAATCGALPNSACRTGPVRWNKSEISVALWPDMAGFSSENTQILDRSLNHAIRQINAANTSVTLRRDDRAVSADILVQTTKLREGQKSAKMIRAPDGQTLGVGYSWLKWNSKREISEATVVITSDIDTNDIPSVVLEELTQSLGFLYDIDNKYYVGKSVLAQDGNLTTIIDQQDKMLLEQHYPKP
jgi:hypothetical protein